QRVRYYDTLNAARRDGHSTPLGIEAVLRSLQFLAQGAYMTHEQRLDKLKAMVKGLTNKKVRIVFTEAVERIPDENARKAFGEFVGKQKPSYLRDQLITWLTEESSEHETWIKTLFGGVAPTASDAS